ncbi:MAG: hypothetical protein SGPRY_001922 [Prymnesium sp.]
MLARAWRSYSEQLASRPLRVKALTSATVSGAGDLLCQLAIQRTERVDWRRLATFTTLGGALVAPALHSWYSGLHKLFPGCGASVVARRLFLDQALFAPLFIPIFMGSVLLVDGHPSPRAKVSEDWWPTVTNNWRLWVPAQLVNFGCVPLQYQF